MSTTVVVDVSLLPGPPGELDDKAALTFSDLSYTEVPWIYWVRAIKEFLDNDNNPKYFGSVEKNTLIYQQLIDMGLKDKPIDPYEQEGWGDFNGE
jgi:hypothetical protein